MIINYILMMFLLFAYDAVYSSSNACRTHVTKSELMWNLCKIKACSLGANMRYNFYNIEFFNKLFVTFMKITIVLFTLKVNYLSRL